MRCIECVHCMGGVEPKMRRLGVNLCAVIRPDHPGQYFTLENERQCPKYEPAHPDTAAARREWLQRT